MEMTERTFNRFTSAHDRSAIITSNGVIDFGVKGRLTESPSRDTRDVVAAYDAVWRSNLPRFNDQASEPSALASAVVDYLSDRRGLAVAVDIAAGSGGDSIRFAQLLSKHVVAMDSSSAATALIDQRKAEYEGRLGAGSSLDVITGDIRTKLRDLGANIAAVVHGGSIWHVLTREEQREVLEAIRGASRPGSRVFLNGKAWGDAIQGRGEIIDEDERGVTVVDSEDGVRRQFARTPEPFLKDFRAHGFEPVKVYRSRRVGYDIKGQPGLWQDYHLIMR